jgi:hypothetical protein
VREEDRRRDPDVGGLDLSAPPLLLRSSEVGTPCRQMEGSLSLSRRAPPEDELSASSTLLLECGKEERVEEPLGRNWAKGAGAPPPLDFPRPTLKLLDPGDAKRRSCGTGDADEFVESTNGRGPASVDVSRFDATWGPHPASVLLGAAPPVRQAAALLGDRGVRVGPLLGSRLLAPRKGPLAARLDGSRRLVAWMDKMTRGSYDYSHSI